MLSLILVLYILSVYFSMVCVILLSSAHIKIMCKHETCKDGQIQRLAAQSCSSKDLSALCTVLSWGTLHNIYFVVGGCIELLHLLPVCWIMCVQWDFHSRNVV